MFSFTPRTTFFTQHSHSRSFHSCTYTHAYIPLSLSLLLSVSYPFTSQYSFGMVWYEVTIRGRHVTSQSTVRNLIPPMRPTHPLSFFLCCESCVCMLCNVCLSLFEKRETSRGKKILDVKFQALSHSEWSSQNKRKLHLCIYTRHLLFLSTCLLLGFLRIAKAL